MSDFNIFVHGTSNMEIIGMGFASRSQKFKGYTYHNYIGDCTIIYYYNTVIWTILRDPLELVLGPLCL